MGGLLCLDGISVTRENGFTGCGVYVGRGGTLLMYSSKISDNKVTGDGGGVYNSGTFAMYGGAIVNNIAGCYGGGVCNWGGSFVMSGGEISGNTANDSGGGVCNRDSIFTMSGGEIFNNWADFSGGGVCNRDGTFSMAGGEISGNTAISGGGVLNMGDFSMSGGKISKNIVHGHSSFISGYGFGGGVSNWAGNLDLRGGKIFGNKASNGGDNVYTLGNVYYFGVRDVVLICTGVVFVVVGVILFTLVFYFKKRQRRLSDKLF
jgi:hypothetical protein